MSENVKDQDPIEAEVLKDELVKTEHPEADIDGLAQDEEQGLAFVDTKLRILQNIRKGAITLTTPNDWLLFNQEGRITGYLQDSGCQRVMPLLGIEVTDVSEPMRVPTTGEPFVYLVRGDGYCRLTGADLEKVEGGRASDEKVVEGLSGAMLEMRVRQMSRANLDGRITRRLAGLSSVLYDEIINSMPEKHRNMDLFPKGKGFGTQADRRNITTEGAPICKNCNISMRLKKGQYGQFWSCPNYPRCKESMKMKDWEELKKKQPVATPEPEIVEDFIDPQGKPLF